MAYIDYQKAFDSIKTIKVIEALKHQGVEETYIDTLKYIYQKSTGTIRMRTESEPFNINKGVRQGDPISPRLFTSVLETVFSNLNWYFVPALLGAAFFLACGFA